jgi:hypothetical protein
MFMRDDYVITIFSPRQGKTRTITLSRHLISWAVAAVLLIIVLSMSVIYSFVEVTRERRILKDSGYATRTGGA